MHFSGSSPQEWARSGGETAGIGPRRRRGKDDQADADRLETSGESVILLLLIDRVVSSLIRGARNIQCMCMMHEV